MLRPNETERAPEADAEAALPPEETGYTGERPAVPDPADKNPPAPPRPRPATSSDEGFSSFG
ncbi:fibronectin-attachment protein (FAP) [Methylobacterium sp. NEAU 140]|uniref:fibronectin-attachment protein (FAP) n=1 Tax=Methylobacterium sp. NEAU 140 TaxID=3064945 RepID=UPI00273319C3|nr:fibronectin-attachment protein (FAP) [Methylobacterium sp. NEAU 140]MDP4024090.1 fibronectin-attachment protein (FAP) [Methylobacterium sp. NEAU 140]